MIQKGPYMDRLCVYERFPLKNEAILSSEMWKFLFSNSNNKWAHDVTRGMGSFKKYVIVEGWGYAPFLWQTVTKNVRSGGGGCQVTLVTQRQKYLVNVSLSHFLMNVPWCLMHWMCLTNFSQHAVCLRNLRIDPFLFSLFKKECWIFFSFDILQIFYFEPKIIPKIFLNEASYNSFWRTRKIPTLYCFIIEANKNRTQQ